VQRVEKAAIRREVAVHVFSGPVSNSPYGQVGSGGW
jgi:hypothetical protein